MRSAPVLGTGRCLIDLGLQQMKTGLNSENFANMLVVSTEIAEIKFSVSFSEEGRRE